ncbi:YheC/YheD family protein [Paenibacillus qinlingensis]|uniref:Glutathione synthase/RimK-type ligase-like ATP-grasp enzyme n=1 Tax=Paenibacillus qinlingensis TaxID=1837343 RepID=A0ABU1NUH7_9BACL|nr:YheC/YheD family protein [Paenibacillus qinlingensis]MDR6550731.1 glutathione synthase/RimK-type ligase-like ATP-grasp enzyme [Paenibacillus qinlingensis]
MDERPLIGIMVSNRRSRKRILNLCLRYQNLNIKLYAFTPTDIQWNKKRIIGLSLKKGKWTQSLFPFPHAVYNRCYNKKPINIQHFEALIGKNKCFNTINFFNKWDLYNQLVQSNLEPYVPDTFLYNEVNISELLNSYKLVYLKPIYGNKGASVYRVEIMENEDIHISLHSLAPRYICRKNESIQEKLDELLGPTTYIVQQGIPMCQLDHQYFDVRVLVQKGITGEWAISTITCRVAHKRYFNTSMCEHIYNVDEVLPRLFSQEKVNDILQSLRDVSIKAAQEAEIHLSSLGELSVDFAIDIESKLRIIEINGMPQKSIYNDIKNFKYKKIIHCRPLEYAYYLSQS